LNKLLVEGKITSFTGDEWHGSLATYLDSMRAGYCSIAFCNGAFDILHDGHLHLLNTAKSLAERLIVGINSDASVKRLKGETRPVNHQKLRAMKLAELEAVNFVVVFEDDTPQRLLSVIRPQVYVLGEEYRDNCPGAEYAGRVHFVERLPGLSTTRIIEAAAAG
jgi:D-beta-D-heptose 7-phosphate kinase / D-beta-D-heptose 1-phosphate adenosyltransferase